MTETCGSSTLIENANGFPITLHVEPRGDEFRLPPGVVVTVRVEANKPGALHVIFKADTVTVYEWVGCTGVAVYHNEKEILGGHRFDQA